MTDLHPETARNPGRPSPPAPMQRSLSLGTLLSGVAILLLVAATWFWSDILLLVFAAILIAIALRAGAHGLNRLVGLNVKLGVAVVLLVVLGALWGAVRLAGPSISDQFTQLVDALPRSWDELNQRLPGNGLGDAVMEQVQETTNIEEDASQLAQRLPDLFGWVSGALNSVFSGLSSLFLMLIVSLYVAIEAPLYRRGAIRLVPMRHRGRAASIMDELGSQLGRWMAGQAFDMFVVAILAGIGLWLLGVPLAFILALIAGITNIVPIVGPFASGAIAVLVSLSQGVETAVYVAILFTAIQMFEGEVLMPLIQRYAVELPPALTILAIVAFGGLFGFVGVVLATPLLIVVMLLVQRIYVQDLLGDPDME
ncbi:AI-2E family transporter [Paracoccus sp. (in: a-proteobacteria)]|uniref:AI-2E family transporter n=1 Tax=Paracoccus sp. TaxID=267 RepID=UPI00396CBDE4